MTAKVYTSIEQVKREFFPKQTEKEKFDCGECRKRRGISPFETGHGEGAECGKCIADKVIGKVTTHHSNSMKAGVREP